jgi:hypothetical protein
MSHGGIQRGVDVRPQPRSVDVRQTPPPIQEGCSAEPAPRKRPKFRDGMPVAGHSERLSTRDPVENSAPVITQLSDRYFGHALSYHR